MAYRSGQGCVSGVDFDRRRLPSFRAGDDSLASVTDKGSGN
jgi:hypothetical protein